METKPDCKTLSTWENRPEAGELYRYMGPVGSWYGDGSDGPESDCYIMVGNILLIVSEDHYLVAKYMGKWVDDGSLAYGNWRFRGLKILMNNKVYHLNKITRHEWYDWFRKIS